MRIGEGVVSRREVWRRVRVYDLMFLLKVA